MYIDCSKLTTVMNLEGPFGDEHQIGKGGETPATPRHGIDASGEAPRRIARVATPPPKTSGQDAAICNNTKKSDPHVVLHCRWIWSTKGQCEVPGEPLNGDAVKGRAMHSASLRPRPQEWSPPSWKIHSPTFWRVRPNSLRVAHPTQP